MSGKKGGGGGTAPIGSGSGAVIRVPAASQQTRDFYFDGKLGISTDAGANLIFAGLAVNYRSIANLVYSLPQWADFIATNYDQFRVVQVRLRFVPFNRYSKVTTLTAPFVVVMDADSVSLAILLESTALQYATARVVSSDDPSELVYAIPPPATEAWYDVASPSEQIGCFAIVSDGPFSASTALGNMYIQLHVRCRGQR